MKISIVGVTGYSGLELIRLIHQHRYAEIVGIYAANHIGTVLSELYPHLQGICDLPIAKFDAQSIIETSDIVFFTTPSGIAGQASQTFIDQHFPIIDLSGDHRLPAATYEKWYHKQTAPDNILEQFSYGLPEIDSPKGKRFIANPGCYATATELALYPLLKEKIISSDNIIVDAKSGLSGAGKTPTLSSHFVTVNGNYTTYKVNQHQHIPEIVQMLKKADPSFEHFQFSTSLLPINRGIVATAYTTLKKDLSEEDIKKVYQESYQNCPFIQIKKDLPSLDNVIGSNNVAIGIAYNPLTKILTIVSVIDNLIKGAAGQAIQNMNLMFDFPETEGLLNSPLYL